MGDEIFSKPYAKWMEECLKGLIEFDPKHIAMVATNEEGETICAHTYCLPTDVFGMAGALHAEGVWMQIQGSGKYLKEIIEEAEDNEAGEEGDSI